MFRNLLFLSLSLFLFSKPTSAEVLFEPFVGYRTESMTITTTSNIDTKLSSTHPSFGLRFGYQSPLGIELNLAGEYSSGQMSITPDNTKSDFTHQTVSAQLGVNAMGLLKIYLGYGFMNDFKLGDPSTISGFTLKGTSYQAGVQIKLLPYLSVGAQYNINDYKTIEGAAFTSGPEIEKYFNKIDVQDFAAQVTINF